MSQHEYLYHYTDAESAREIMRDGVIRAKSQFIYRDLIPDQSRSREIGPIVWLTINPVLDGIVATKLRSAGWELVGGLARVVVPYLCDTGLGDYADRHQIEKDWFGPMIQTGNMVGSHYSCWRLCERDITRDELLRVEVLRSIDSIKWEVL